MVTHDIFLCHSHRDKKFVRELADNLDHFHIKVYLDEWDLEPGDSLHNRIGKALINSRYVGVILSPDSVNSNWCKNELESALAKEKYTGKRNIIPIMCRKVTCPTFLLDRLYLDFRNDYFNSLTQLVGFLLGINTKKFKVLLTKHDLKRISDVEFIIKSFQKESKNKINKVTKSQKVPKKISPLKTKIKPEYKKASDESPKKPSTKNSIYVKGQQKAGRTVSEKQAPKVFGLDLNWFPLELARHKFIDNNDGTVTDMHSGLMWQTGGSDRKLFYADVEKYLRSLNGKTLKFWYKTEREYNDWRIPNVVELMTLFVQEEGKNHSLLHPVFANDLTSSWSFNRRSQQSNWYVDFKLGRVGWSYSNKVQHYVKAVRSL